MIKNRYMKKLLPYVFSILLSVGIANAQVKDSVRTYTLQEVNVSATTKNVKKNILENVNGKTFFYEDPDRKLTMNPGVISILPIITENRIDNLPSDLSGLYYGNDMSIPILGSKTQFQGAASKVNSLLADMDVDMDVYSSAYNHIGGIKRIIPKKYSNTEVNVSGDFTDRKIIGAVADLDFLGFKINARGGYREISVFEWLKNAISSLELLPDVHEIDAEGTITKDKTSLEYYLTNSKQTQRFKGDTYNISEITQDTKYNFSVVKASTLLGDYVLKLAASNEFEGQESTNIYDGVETNVETGSRNFAINSEAEKRGDFKVGFAEYFFRNKNLKEISRDVAKVYFEKKIILEDILLEPSVSLSNFKTKNAPSVALRASYFFNSGELNFGVGRYSTFLFDNNTILGVGTFSKGEERPYVGEHYFVSMKKEMNGFDADLSVFLKKFEFEYMSEGYSKGKSYGLRFKLDSTPLHSTLTAYVSGSEINGHKLAGAIDNDIQYYYWFNIGDLTINTNITYRNGAYTKNNKRYSRLNDAFSFSLGISKSIEMLGTEVNISVTGFNLLGQTELLRRINQQGNYISEKAPRWGNVMIDMKKSL